jgi:NAD(P)-dependent dehydrogenase (short-subunit alcohol dehydrogenase family)
MPWHYVVVGGSRGLGRAFAAARATSGHVVSVVSRSIGDAPGVNYHQCDLDHADAPTLFEAIRRRSGPIDALAFFQRYRGTGDAWDGELRTSLSATRSLVEASPGYFAADGLRSIVLVSSVNAFFVSSELPPGYHVAKAGLCQLARYYACTLGPLGIRVNAVCPSTFVKPETESYYGAGSEVASRLAAMSPLGRMGTHREMNDVVLFLLGEQSSFVTGQALVVDGGISLRWPEHN